MDYERIPKGKNTSALNSQLIINEKILFYKLQS